MHATGAFGRPFFLRRHKRERLNQNDAQAGTTVMPTDS
ncbi:hypothetical protein C7S14_5245 [Burkholderia cepacia]|nr:hypothetical protein C7S14_5245 [Burkholderia cepacia]